MSEKLTTARDELKTAQEALAVEVEKLQQLKQESVAKTSELANATENESKLAGELASLAQAIGTLADELQPLKKVRDAKVSLVTHAEKIVRRWQDEAKFAQSKTANN